MKNIVKKKLYKRVISDSNIYSAIYSLESYVFEVGLLNDSDLELYNKLSDKYDTTLIKEVINECKARIEEVLTSDKLFDIEVFFKPKKYNEQKECVDFRPLHTADLFTQISIVAMLNIIMFDDTDDKRRLSDISKLLPSNFYGNMPSVNVEQVFQPWSAKYKEYSENSIKANNEYSVSGKYISEINLDLKSFYPSINPQYIYEYILNKLPVTYKSDDVKVIKQILNKLLYFNVKSPENFLGEYYPEKSIDKIKKNELFYNIGLPQGLPQSYFFGNLCMIEIANETKKEFDGDAYYYVDDSIIYSNFIDYSVENTQFHKAINKVNKAINNNIEKIINGSTFNENISNFSDLIDYKVEIHNNVGGKSTIDKISIGDYLLDLNKPASTISFEIRASIDEDEDDTLRAKVKAILDLIKIKLKSENLNQQNKKLLKRFKKFYTFRLKLLKLREDNEITEEIISEFYERYGIKDSPLKIFGKSLEDDIFIFEARLLIKHLIVDKIKTKEFIDNIKMFENKLSNSIGNNRLYVSKTLDSEQIKLSHKNKSYNSLEFISDGIVEPFIKVKQYKKIEAIRSIVGILNDCVNIDPLNRLQDRVYNLLKVYNAKDSLYYFIHINSLEFKRKILNSLISKVLNIQISDNTNLIKIDNRAIHYFELRLIMYIRSYNYNENEFVLFTNKLLSSLQDNNDNEKMDLALFEVLPIFKRYIKSPSKVDSLILAHKYVNGIWKNGSKFLHFYTLHNEEHSIELINNSIRITKAIDYLSLKDDDYYALFLACYFHDISMVLYPNLDNFSEDKLETNLIYSEWRCEFKDIENQLSNASEVKKFIKKSYDKVNDYFEKEIRDNHPKKSSKFIKEQKDLSFINDEIRQIVANVSEAHGYDARDVYKLKSKAKSDLHDEKYLMIILRLADLLDMSKDRVSINVLRQNIEHMSDNSKYHWISHMAVDHCSLQTKFEAIEKDIKIEELVSINIQLNTKQLTVVEAPLTCDYNCVISEERDVNNKGYKKLTISLNEKPEKCLKCNFTCKWMMNKHEYLFQELIELDRYLNRNPNNIFRTKFNVILSLYDNGSSFPSEYMDVIKEVIDK